MSSFRMIVHYLLRSRQDFIRFAVLQVFSIALTLMVPIYIGRLVGSLDPNLPQSTTPENLIMTFLLIITLAISAFLVSASSRTYSAKIAARALYFVRKDINDAIYRQSFSYFDKHETGQLVARATSDVDQTEHVFGMGLMVMMQGMLQLGGALVMVALIQPTLIGIFFGMVLFSLSSSVALAYKLSPIFIESREAFGSLTSTIRENIVGAQVVRMFGTQEKEKLKFAANNKRFYDASVRSVKWTSLYSVINSIVIGTVSMFTLVMGGSLVIQGSMPLSTLISILGYISMTIFPLFAFGQFFTLYVQANAAMVRIQEVIKSVPEIIEDPNPVTTEITNGDVAFQNVSFGYTSGSLVLKDVSFHVSPGKTIAILGTTGSGKSTIINLLPRFYDVSAGQILIDGIDVRKYRLKDLRRHIGLVSQDTFLFDTTIRENITFGRENASMDEVIEAARIADLHDFIMSLPEGYDTLVGERGARLSGGQKQRLSIARAIITHPKILILDDSTSSVDVATEYNIQQALEHVIKDSTTFIITQRISTIRTADEIMLLDAGRIVGFGTHEELLEHNALYHQIFETLQSKQQTKITENPSSQEPSEAQVP